MPAEGVKIVQMQTPIRLVINAPGNFPAADLNAFEQAQMEAARAELSRLQADGYEIANVTVGGYERVLLTVWTLRPVEPSVAVQNFIMGDDRSHDAFHDHPYHDPY